MSDPVQSATEVPGEGDARHIRAYVQRVGDMIDGSKERLAEARDRFDDLRAHLQALLTEVPAAVQNALDALQADLDAARASLAPPAPPPDGA